MTVRRIDTLGSAGGNKYFAVTRLSDGHVFDWHLVAGVPVGFVVLGSAVTPGVAMTALVAYGDSTSEYGGDLDMALVNPSATPEDVVVTCFDRVGGSMAPATDTPISRGDAFSIAAGEIGPLSGQDCEVDCTANLTTTSGISMHFTAELLHTDGSGVPLATIDPSATCAIVVTQDATSTGGARIPQFSLSTTDCGGVNASDRFEVEYENPNLTANRGFTAEFTIITGGKTYVGRCKFFS